MARPKPTAKPTQKPTSPRRPADGARPPGDSAPVEHEGATEAQTGDRTGPGAGFDLEPEQVKDKGGVS